MKILSDSGGRCARFTRRLATRRFRVNMEGARILIAQNMRQAGERGSNVDQEKQKRGFVKTHIPDRTAFHDSSGQPEPECVECPHHQSDYSTCQTQPVRPYVDVLFHDRFSFLFCKWSFGGTLEIGL